MIKFVNKIVSKYLEQEHKRKNWQMKNNKT